MCELISKYESRRTLEEQEEAELARLRDYRDKFERDYAALGEDGIEALQLFQLLDGQRIAGFADVGDINFSAIEFVFGLYDVERERRLQLFERIIKIDEAVGEWRRKQKK